jgi:hypothetical protein
MEENFDEEMFTKFENCLNLWTNPVKKELLLNAVEVLAKHGSYRAWTEISQFLEYASNEGDTSNSIEYVENCLTIDLERVLEEHTIITDTTMDVRVSILEGLLFVDAVEDCETILGFINGSDNEMDLLFQLLEYATNKPWDYFSDGILSVSPFLIERLEEVLNERNISTEEEDDNPDKPKVEKEKLEKLSSFIEKFPNSIITEAISDDFMAVGLTLNILCEKFKLSITNLQSESAKHAAIELLGLVLCSDTPFANIVTETKKLIEYFFNDIRFVTEVDMALETVVREVYNG